MAAWAAGSTARRREYADWPALRKLEFVDGLMAEIARQPPLRHSHGVSSSSVFDFIGTLFLNALTR